MTTNKSYRIVTILLLLLPLLMMGWKLGKGYLKKEVLIPEIAYQVQFNFMLDSDEKGKELFIKTYLPESNQHQQISWSSSMNGDLQFTAKPKHGIGKKGIWEGQIKQAQQLSYSFKYKGKALRYKLDDKLPYPAPLPDEVFDYLEPEEYIQSDHVVIQRWADDLTKGKTSQYDVVKSLYKFVKSLANSKTSKLTDALTALKKFRASCNGKSRLLVALCRASGIPARVVGGIILEDTQKRTSHLWVEMWLGDQWVPFDALNGHFAYLPPNYLELYRGDHFLVTHTPNINFDYIYAIQKEEYFSPREAGGFTLWSLLGGEGISMSLLKVILLLPLCALVVGIFRNVIGLKTIGVFLPAIIAVSLDGVGLGLGLMAFIIVVAVVGLLHFPLERWGVLHTPKLIIMLTAVVVCLLSMGYIGLALEIHPLSTMVLFPIIVLTIAAEKFARTIIEEGPVEAFKLQGQTLLLTIVCYLIFKPDFTVGYFLTFPETYILIIGILLLLGRWIGLRMTEYFRFGALSNT